MWPEHGHKLVKARGDPGLQGLLHTDRVLSSGAQQEAGYRGVSTGCLCPSLSAHGPKSKQSKLKKASHT